MNLKKSGFTIVEVAVAMGLLMIIGTAMMTMVLLAIALTTSAKMKNIAVRRTEAKIEVIRAERDRQAAGGSIDFNTVCVPIIEYPTEGGLLFKRTTTCTIDSSGQRLKVEVTTNWEEKGQNREVKISTYLTKWQ